MEVVLHQYFLYERYEKKNLTPSWPPRRAGSKHVRIFTLKGQYQNLTSGQVRSRSDHGPSRSMFNMHIFRSGSTSQVVWHHLRVSISILLRLIGKKLIVTSFDFRPPWPPIVSCTRICTDGVSGNDPERIGWFRLVYAKRETFSYFPTGL